HEALLDHPRLRVAEPEGVTVTVVDEPREVRRSHHVEVQVQGHRLALGRQRGEVLVDQDRVHVVRRPAQTGLLRAPEGKAYLVRDWSLGPGQLQRRLEDRRPTRAIVVDPGARLDRV